MTGLSVRALRLYDEVGLLKPAQIESHNKYRYYEQKQIAIAQRIKMFRECELSLEDIRNILEQPKNSRTIFEQHLVRLHQRLEQHKTMIGQLEQLITETR